MLFAVGKVNSAQTCTRTIKQHVSIVQIPLCHGQHARFFPILRVEPRPRLASIRYLNRREGIRTKFLLLARIKRCLASEDATISRQKAHIWRHVLPQRPIPLELWARLWKNRGKPRPRDTQLLRLQAREPGGVHSSSTPTPTLNLARQKDLVQQSWQW